MPSRWTKGEAQYLRENAPKMTAAEIAKAIDKSHRAVTQKATYEGIRCVHNGVDGRRGWTKKEILELATLAEKHTIDTAAQKLKRSRASVAQAAAKHKVSFHKRRLTLQQAANVLNVHRETVRRIRDHLGLSFRQNVNTASTPTRTRGATGDDIAAIAQHLLSNPCSSANLRVTAKHLRSVIAEWEGYE